MTIMTSSKSRNSIKYNLPFLIKLLYIMCLQNDTYIVKLTFNDINRLNKPGIWLCDNIIMRFLPLIIFSKIPRSN